MSDQPAAPDYYERVLAHMPDPTEVWEEAHDLWGGTTNEDYYAACKFQGLYVQCRTLLAALAAHDGRTLP